MGTIKLTQIQLLEILESHYKKGNENIEINTKDFVKEIIQSIEKICKTNSVNSK